MEHLHLRWVPTITNSGAWKIVTDEAEPWIIAELAVNLPGDQTGEITASAICRLHNLNIGVAPMNRPRFDLEGDPRPCWIDRALEQAARVHWSQCFFAGLLVFALGLLAWGCV